MPEGDTIASLARRMHAELAGQSGVDVLVPSAGETLPQSRIVRVHARGKHLLIELADGHTLQSHLGMDGTWRRFRDHAPVAPAPSVGAVITTQAAEFVLFNPKEVRLLRPRGDRLRRHTLVRRVGPDLTTDVAIDQVVARVYGIATPDALMLDVLLDQRIAGGIGNVFKCELMFVQRWPLSLRVGAVTVEQLHDVYALAATWLKANVGNGRRLTRGLPGAAAEPLGGIATDPVGHGARRTDRPAARLTGSHGDDSSRLWVYGRTGQPCYVCATPIASVMAGRKVRRTWSCPHCQSAA
ncbi:MAG: DNA-formamidopyrimidine glycosylase family protein [Pseudomonadota bacterium]